jgi:branched-chain amino acid transport system ATP-binding protein
MLEIKDLVVDYGIVKAVKGINIHVPKGSIVALLGANGAGKTTTIKAISGQVKVKSGSITLNGEPIHELPSYEKTKKGIMLSPEGRQIFYGFTVEENLKIGAYRLSKIKGMSSTTRIQSKLDEIYALFPILKSRRTQQATTLSGGEQQMLSIGRALMKEPDLLLLDEPSLGLAPLIVKDIFDIIKQLKSQGQTVLIVEQNAYQTLKIADYAYVLELGHIKIEGKGEDLLQDDSLIKAYLGH